MKNLFLWGLFSIGLSTSSSLTAQWKGKPVDFSHGRIEISDNHRYLQHKDGTPFFYLGDTAWELFHRLNREEADLYLTNRASKGFTVIQAVALAELDGHTVPNAYGHLPLEQLDPARPATKAGAENDYWDHVDYIIQEANRLGMYVGLLPTWGRYWHDNIYENGNQPLFNPTNAQIFGEFLGNRYQDCQIIWILGGDRNIENEYQKQIIRAMAEGIKKGSKGRQLITFHPSGGKGSSEWFHNEAWLDFNMRQNGHNQNYPDAYSRTLDDYRLQPTKPVIDGEPLYEDHPLMFRPDRYGHSIAADVRRPFYWNLFSGACGHTYGHHSIWQMFDPIFKRTAPNYPLMSWKEALNQPGSQQMTYGRMLMESRPMKNRIPDDSIIVASSVTTAIPGSGCYRFVATRDEASTYLMVYAPIGRSFTVRTRLIKGEKLKAWWYNPRNGKAQRIGIFKNSGEMEFTPPEPGEVQDWVLVIDDASCSYPAPGKPFTP